MKQTETKIGVLVHMDTLKNCVEMLQTPEQRAGLVETLLHAYYPRNFQPSTDHWVLSSWKFLEDNIKRNDAKFERNSEKQQKNWANWRDRKAKEAKEAKEEKERLRRENEKLLQQLQIAATNTSAIEVKSSPVPSSITTTTSSPMSSSEIVDNSTIEDNNKNSNSLSKYTKEQVRVILEEREIFFKENHFMAFWMLNSTTFHWKYDPYVAALAYIKNHPDCMKKGREIDESAPQFIAAPPNLKEVTDAVYRQYWIAGDKLWKEVVGSLGKLKLPTEQQTVLQHKTAVLSGRFRWSDNWMRLAFDDVVTQEDVEKLDSCEQFQQALKEHNVKHLKYSFSAKKNDAASA